MGVVPMLNIHKDGPTWVESGSEPSLFEIVYRYYRQAFEPEEAKKLAYKYLKLHLGEHYAD